MSDLRCIQITSWRGDTTAIREVVLDFTGTLSKDGTLLPGIAQSLLALSGQVHITVLTADTFGTVERALAGLPVEVQFVQSGREKAAIVERMGPEGVVAIGNGRNDAAMVERAALGIAVIGPEGAAGELIRVADLVVRDIHDALGLLAHPLRLKATLRD